MSSIIQTLAFLFWLILIPTLYLLPTIIAIRKKHPQKVPIILVNIFGGLLLGIGWLIALIWCFVEPARNPQAPTSAAREIEKLHALKEKGVLTQSEFEARKKALLEG